MLDLLRLSVDFAGFAGWRAAVNSASIELLDARRNVGIEIGIIAPFRHLMLRFFDASNRRLCRFCLVLRYGRKFETL